MCHDAKDFVCWCICRNSPFLKILIHFSFTVNRSNLISSAACLGRVRLHSPWSNTLLWSIITSMCTRGGVTLSAGCWRSPLWSASRCGLFLNWAWPKVPWERWVMLTQSDVTEEIACWNTALIISAVFSLYNVQYAYPSWFTIWLHWQKLHKIILKIQNNYVNFYIYLNIFYVYIIFYIKY